MDKAKTLKKIQDLEFHANACLQISAELREDLGLNNEKKISKYLQKKMEREEMIRQVVSKRNKSLYNRSRKS